ncbi:hypothetical protein [Desulfovibrio oxyclinae]|uniref:hypothetical protein n=1 Tax=Desulfovibrio oxyclinae TaxID=63560 RepID=UPI0003765508|nr:hypothetical protein [Desulfovibrio oxyclinae]
MDTLEFLKDSLALDRPAAPEAVSSQDIHLSMAPALNERMEKEPDLDLIVPFEKRGMMRENHINHFRYMHSVARVFSHGDFVETVAWAMRTYRGHGFALEYWRRMLPHCIELCQSRLPLQESRFLVGLYEWILGNIQELDPLTAPEQMQAGEQ